MRKICLQISVLLILITGGIAMDAQLVLYTMPEETTTHEGTWIQWPHNYLYGPWYRADVEPTFIAMANALQMGENVHIIAYDSTELSHIITVLGNASVPLTHIDFFVHETDDVWSRDNGPMFVYDQNNNLTILDWGFNGWGFDTPYSKCDVIPLRVSADIGVPRVDLSGMVLEGGAIEHDGNRTMMATRSSVTHSSRNPSLTETQIENYLTTYMGITKFIWLDGVYGSEITDMHIDGFMKFANDSTIVTMDSTDLDYWELSAAEINTIYSAANLSGKHYHIVFVPLTQNNVLTTYGNNLGFKGSYCNYYVANNAVLVPTYNDPKDAVAISIIQGLYPNRTAIGIDVRNLYEYGGMIHCVTQQQPVSISPSEAQKPLGNSSYRLQNSPNPFTRYTIIRFSASENALATVEVFNSLGQRVTTLTPKLGGQEVIFKTDRFESGIYMYSLRINGQIVESSKMIVQ